MEIIRYCGAALAAVVCLMILRQGKSEYAVLVSSASCLLMMAGALRLLTPVLQYVNGLTSQGGLGEYTGTVIKAVGIGMLTQTTSDICRDAGENAAAAKLELLGKAEILLLSLPLVKALLMAASEIIL